MPIYEFYCTRCNTIYNFFSRSVNTEKIPDCLVCKNVKLIRQVSLFAAVSGSKGESETEPGMLSFDESKMERAIAMLESEGSRIDENDPKQAARFMRKLTEAAGISMGSGMEEALDRLERGEDPEAIEQEMGDALEEEEPFMMERKERKTPRRSAPRRDETLYEL
jgi:putative FmdB family regulatory protein